MTSFKNRIPSPGAPRNARSPAHAKSTLSKTLEDDLTAEGNFFLECIHNCGHSEPPLDPPADGSSIYSPLWGFFLDHPFWLKDGESPYQKGGLPPNMPEWCGIGKASATPREGPCSGGGC